MKFSAEDYSWDFFSLLRFNIADLARSTGLLDQKKTEPLGDKSTDESPA